MLKSIRSFDLKNKRVLMRLDLNVPLKDGVVADDFRIRAAVPTIQHCLKGGASVVLMSHLGRPNGETKPELSLMPIGESLAELLEMPIKFSHDCVSEDAHDVSLGLRQGEVHLLENLRFHEAETRNDPDFSAALSKQGGVYINDAFGTAHRAHASNVGVSKHFNYKGIGFLIEKELRYLQGVVEKPQRPLVLVLGGAKIESKLGLIYNFMDNADTILIGGGMVFTFLRARGYSIGKSLVDESMLNSATKIIQKATSQKMDMQFPMDVNIAPEISEPDARKTVKIDNIPVNQIGLDIGPESVEAWSQIIREAGTIVWNGPMGVFETPGFDEGSRGIAEAMADARQRGAIAVVGGGDTASAVKQFELTESMSHVSTGGGASLELLSGNHLPALVALES